MLGVGREVSPFLLEIIRLEGDGAVVEVGIVQQHAAAIDKHRVGLVGMALHKPFGHVRCHLHTVQDTLHAQRRLVQNRGSAADGLLAHGLTRLVEQESEGHIEDDGSEEHHPQTNPHRELTTDICDNFFH